MKSQNKFNDIPQRADLLTLPFAFPKKADQKSIVSLKALVIRQWYDTIEKYWTGWLEHGGCLPDKFTVKGLLIQALEENIDQSVFLRTALQKLEDEARGKVAIKEREAGK